MAAKRWDPIVKLTHWGIAAAVIGNALFTEEGSGWHIWIGYGLAALLTLRLLWGLAGPREARFGSFPPSLMRAGQHLREIRRAEVTHYASHNPLGALMVYAIWGTLLVVIGTGIAMAGPPPTDPRIERSEQGEVAGRSQSEEHGEESDEGEEGSENQEEDTATELHELAVNLLYVLIVLHLMGVLFETRRSGSQIVGAMLPQRRGGD